MTPLLFYLLKQAAIAGLCFAYYGLVLRNKARHQRSRWFLAGSVLASLLLPLVPVYWPASPEGGLTLPLAVQTILLPTVQVGGTQSATSMSLPRFETLYAGIALLLLLRVGYNCWRLWRLRQQSQLSWGNKVILARNANVGLPFSFFNVVFWNAAMPTGSDAGSQILQHEMVHVRQRHSLDKLLLELVCACCWINPFFYLYRREMALVHEFLADEGAAHDKAHYAETILHTVFQPAWALTNSFFHPPIQRRIQMLFSKPTKISFMKKLALLPLGLALAAVMSCQQQNDTALKIPPPPPPANPADQLKGISWEDLNKIPADRLEAMNVLPHDSIIITLKDGTRYLCMHHHDKVEFKSSDNKEVFTFVENPPTFPGGENALNNFLSKNIKYPKAAVDQSREGTVFVQFVVNQDGHIRDAKIVGKPHPDLDEEALRVINMMPDWNAGTQDGKKVSVQFNLPVRFVLDKKVAMEQAFIALPWLEKATQRPTGC